MVGVDPESSGDLGDFASFVTHMKALAKVSRSLVVFQTLDVQA